MAEDRVEKVIDIRVNYSDAIEKIAEYNTELERTQEQEKALKKNRDKMDNATYQKNLAALKNEQKQYTEGIRVLNKQIQNQIKSQKAQGDSLNAMRAKLSLLNAQFDNMSKEEREAADGGQKLAKEIADLSNEIKDAEYATNRFYRNVGNYPSAFNGLKGGIKGLLGNFSQLGSQLKTMFVGGGLAGGILALVGAMKSGVSTAANFNAEVSKLAAILQTTSEEIPELVAQAKELGATTRYTASEVAQLQTELAKLGYTRKEITDMTSSVLLFAQATGADLADAASLIGATLRMFGDDSSKAQEYVDKMSLATTSSALSFEYLSNAMSTVGPVANSFGFSIEDVLALLGQLANAGFDASSASTALRNIMLNLADPAGKLAKALGTPVQSIGDLTNGLRTLSDRGIDLAETLELTDKRSVAAFNTFLQSASGVDALNKSLQEANGTAKEMAETMEDNLQGDLTSLSSAWEGLMVEINNGQGILRTFVQWLTELVRGINQFIQTTKQYFADLYDGSMLVRGAVEGMVFSFQSGFEIVGGILTSTIDLVKVLGKTLQGIFTLDWNLIKDSWGTGIDNIISTWKEAISTIRTDKLIAESNMRNGRIGVDTGVGVGAAIQQEQQQETAEKPYKPQKTSAGSNTSKQEEKAAKEREKAQKEAEKAAEKAAREYERQLEKELALTMKNAEEEVRIEQEKIDLKLAAVKKGTEEEFALRKQALDAQEDAEWIKAQQSIKDEELLEEKRLLILEKYGQKRKELQRQIDVETWEQQKAAAEQMFNEQLYAARENEVEMARLKTEYTQKQLEQELQRGQLETETKVQYDTRILDLQRAHDEAMQELAQKNTEVQVNKLDAIGSAVGGLASIMEAFGDQSKALAKASKILALGEVAVNTGKAIAAGVAQAQSVPFPANLAAIATTIATIMGNIATAISTIKSAKFAKGGKVETEEQGGKVEQYATGGKVDGQGSGTSDSITARLSNGESVMTALTTSLFSPLLSSLNQMGGGVPIGQSGAGTAAMGEDMLARAFAKGAASLPRPVVSVEEVTDSQNRVEVLEQLATL